MIKFEKVVTPSPEQWERTIMGARNAKNSWDRSDSYYTHIEDAETLETASFEYFIGENDLKLLTALRNAGTDHRKFMRYLTVYVDITAPLYWWKEFDTYKVGTVANSCSTMHKIHAKEFTLDDFSLDHCDMLVMDIYSNHIITALNMYRNLYNDANTRLKLNHWIQAERKHIVAQRKWFWWQMIQLLPSSYNQKRTVMLNYEVLAHMYNSRKNHKLDEWSIGFTEWVKTLPYSEFITGDFKECLDDDKNLQQM